MTRLYRGCARRALSATAAWRAAAMDATTIVDQGVAEYVASLRHVLVNGAVLCGGPFTGYEAWIAAVLADVRIHVALDALNQGPMAAAPFTPVALATHVWDLARAQGDDAPTDECGHAPIQWLHPPVVVHLDVLQALPPAMRAPTDLPARVLSITRDARVRTLEPV